jgi:hypothetical protein
MSRNKNDKKLDDFFVGGSVKPLTEAADFDRGEDSFLYLGSNWCGHSQLGTAHFAEGCRAPKAGNDRQCYGIDIGTGEGKELAKELEIPKTRGVPALFSWNSGEGKWKKLATGRLKSYQYKRAFEEQEGGL